MTPDDKPSQLSGRDTIGSRTCRVSSAWTRLPGTVETWPFGPGPQCHVLWEGSLSPGKMPAALA